MGDRARRLVEAEVAALPRLVVFSRDGFAQQVTEQESADSAMRNHSNIADRVQACSAHCRNDALLGVVRRFPTAHTDVGLREECVSDGLELSGREEPHRRPVVLSQLLVEPHRDRNLSNHRLHGLDRLAFIAGHDAAEARQPRHRQQLRQPSAPGIR